MFKRTSLQEGLGPRNRLVTLPPASGGLNFVDSLAAMRPQYAVALDNWVAYPDRVEMRYGAANHVTGFSQAVKGLWTWDGPSSSQLFATCDNGVFAATTAGAVGAAAVSLTNGATVATTIATGAGTYLLIVNSTDDLRQYDGATWTTVAAFGGLNTNAVSCIETYKQRIFMSQENTLTLWYLPVNSIAGAATSYPLGAIFRKGGSITSIATWTVDGGAGPDDHLAVATSSGEVAVFSGTDPSSAATWALRGVYYIGRPLGSLSLYKYGGELLFLTEAGLWPLSRALQSASVDRTQLVSRRIQPLLSSYAATYGATQGWQLINHPDVPFLLLNVPGTASGTQLVMHSDSGAWSTFTGWAANCWARLGNQLYFGGSNRVAKAWTGGADFGANITATLLQAYNSLSYPRDKQVVKIRPTFSATGDFSYTLGIDNDFINDPTSNLISSSGTTAALWGSGIWGTSLWSSSNVTKREWRTVPDIDGVYKALYCQVMSQTVRPSIQSMDVLYIPGSTF